MCRMRADSVRAAQFQPPGAHESVPIGEDLACIPNSRFPHVASVEGGSTRRCARSAGPVGTWCTGEARCGLRGSPLDGRGLPARRSALFRKGIRPMQYETVGAGNVAPYMPIWRLGLDARLARRNWQRATVCRAQVVKLEGSTRIQGDITFEAELAGQHTVSPLQACLGQGVS